MNIRIFLLVAVSAFALSACGGSSANNRGNVAVFNAASNAGNSMQNAATPSAPESTNSLGNAPSATPTANRLQPAGTPTNSNVRTSSKAGATPTPGVPSAEEMKRLMTGQPKRDPNQPPASMQGPPMMKSNRPLGGRMSGNSNSPE